MNGERIEELLLKLLEDMAEVKAKLDALEKQQLSQRIDKLEAECREHAKTIKSLENRSNAMEQFVRNNLQDSRKQQTGVFISLALAVFSFILTGILNLI